MVVVMNSFLKCLNRCWKKRNDPLSLHLLEQLVIERHEDEPDIFQITLIDDEGGILHDMTRTIQEGDKLTIDFIPDE